VVVNDPKGISRRGRFGCLPACLSILRRTNPLRGPGSIRYALGAASNKVMPLPGASLHLCRCLGRHCFTAPHSDSHFHTRPEPVDDRHEAIDCEPPEVGIANAREVGRRNPGAAVRCAHAQTVAVERLDDFGGQDGLELSGICFSCPRSRKTFPLPRTTFSFSLFIATSPSISSNGS
jgi:hypothetical protein